MILADTSVWIEHLFRSEPIMKERVERKEVVTHPFVVGEIALGKMRRRADILLQLSRIPATRIVSPEEALKLVERHQLEATGIGYVDVHLLASTLITPHCRLWTFDRRLAAVAARLGVGETLH